MTDEERKIWRAAYAAAFVADFERLHSYGVQCGLSDAFDRSASSTTAERAITIADLAVARLREWRIDENPSAGTALEPHPKEWDE